jgi:hypothetical protein
MIFKIAPGTFLVEDTCNPLVRRSMLAAAFAADASAAN